MDEETKALLAQLKGALEILTAQKNAAGASETEIKALQDQYAKLSTDVKALAQQKASFSILGTKSAERGQALGCAMKAMHAARLAGVRVEELDRANESTLKGLGFFGEEKEAGLAILKTMQATSDTSGGLFVPTQLLAEQWVDTLRPSEKVVFAAGAKLFELPMGAGGVMLPRKKTNTSVVKTGENGSGSQTEMTWEMITLKVRRATGYGPISKRLTMSVPEYQAIFQNDITKTLLLEMQRQGFYGTGAEGETCGIKNDPGVNKFYVGSGSSTASTATKRFSYTNFADLEDVIAELDGRVEGSACVTHPRVIRNMKKERSTNFSGQTSGGTPLFSFNPAQTTMSDKMLRELVGYEWYRLTQMASNNAIGSTDTDGCDLFFGQFDNLWFYTYGGVRLQTSDQATVGGVSAFTDNLLWMKGDVEFDCLIKQPKELIYVPDCKGTVITGE